MQEVIRTRTCGWETGSDALNTGATGNEGVWDTSNGTISRVLYDYEGSYGIEVSSQDNAYVVFNNNGAWGTDTAIVRAEFEITNANFPTGSDTQLIRFGNSVQSTVFEILITQVDTADTVEIGCASVLTTVSREAVGVNQTISEDTKYVIIGKYSNSTDDGEAQWWLYTGSGTLLYTSPAASVTLPSVDVDFVRLGSYGYQLSSYFDAVIIDDVSVGTP